MNRPARLLPTLLPAPSLVMTQCPECDSPAEVVDRFVAESSDGPIEEVKVRCLQRHWFLLPVFYLERN